MRASKSRLARLISRSQTRSLGTVDSVSIEPKRNPDMRFPPAIFRFPWFLVSRQLPSFPKRNHGWPIGPRDSKFSKHVGLEIKAPPTSFSFTKANPWACRFRVGIPIREAHPFRALRTSSETFDLSVPENANFTPRNRGSPGWFLGHNRDPSGPWIPFR